jgi:hypothetical protein
MPLKDLVSALNAVGKESVLLDLPQVIHEKIRTLSGHTAFDLPNNKNNSSATVAVAAKNNIVFLLVIIMALIYHF